MTTRTLTYQPDLALPVLLSGTVMVALDFFVVNVALPAIAADLGASAGAVEWSVAGYALALALGLITGSRLGDRFGRRRMFGAGLALFTATSAACGLAPTPGALVAGRVAQGLAAALMMPQVLSLIGTLYDGEARTRALAVYGTTQGVAAAGGQLLGGLLVGLDPAGLGWRACFLINVPIGVAGLIALRRAVPEARPDAAQRLDVPGVALVTLGLGALVLPLVEGRPHGWPTWTWVSLAAAPLVLAGFAAWQRRVRDPLVPPALVRLPGMVRALAGQLAFWSGQASFFLVLALYLQQGRGLSALQAGLLFTLLAGPYLLTSMRRGSAVTGAALIAGGHGLVALAVAEGGTDVALELLAPGLMLVGAGMGYVLVALNAAVMGGAPAALAGAAAGVMATVQQVGAALGVAVTGVVFFGALDRGYGHAFELAVLQLAALALVVAGVTRRPAAAR